MNNREAYRALKALVGTVRVEGVDAWGNGSSRNGWLSIVIPNKDLASAELAATLLGIRLYSPICSNIYGTHRLINMEKANG